ncbi:MAG: hypothetical protein ACK4SI_09665 [Brevundimonas aurantiaca]|uniref:hypothetical protein n=1 Tax=Brevundimonas aurantiaca TaxID=74316 RepID=UPI003918D12C
MSTGKVRVWVGEKNRLPQASATLERAILAAPRYSKGSRTEMYRPEDLKMSEKGRRRPATAAALTLIQDHWRRTGKAVPYAVRLADGRVRSLDAGILGYLSNRSDPEIMFEQDRSGYITGVRPAVGGGQAAKVEGYTLELLATRGLAPTMALLIEAAERGEVVSYKALAIHLERALGVSFISPRHMGHPAGSLMSRLLEVEPGAPLLNFLVVRRDDLQPGAGAIPYLRRRYGLKGRLSAHVRREHIQRELNAIRSYGDWRGLYRRLFRTPPPISSRGDRLADYEADGQRDNPRFGSGGPESPEHKALKQYIVDHPEALRMGLREPKTRPECELLSGDRMDVEVLDGDRRIGVEVKSQRSGDLDLQRGVYQCIKYRAVMKAESGFGEQANCEAVLVLERQPTERILRLAKALEVKIVVVPESR